jgi:hypothetical protein
MRNENWPTTQFFSFKDCFGEEIVIATKVSILKGLRVAQRKLAKSTQSAKFKETVLQSYPDENMNTMCQMLKGLSSEN